MIAPREQLILARKKLGLTQEALAKQAQIERTYLVNIEKGKHTPSLPVADRIAKALNTSIEDLFL